MMGDPSLGIFNQNLKEATWCRICAFRDACKIKEMVATEQHMVCFSTPKYLDVTVKCRKYINDPKAPPAKNALEGFFKI